MRAVRIESFDDYVKAIEVLIELGGTYQGAGTAKDRYLLLDDKQYRALQNAGVVLPNGEKESQRARRKGKSRRIR